MGRVYGRGAVGALAAHSGGQAGDACLCTRSCVDLSDKLLMNMLEAYGIPCLCMERGNGNLGRVYLGISGYGTDIYVPENLLLDAKQLCEEENNEEL